MSSQIRLTVRPVQEIPKGLPLQRCIVLREWAIVGKERRTRRGVGYVKDMGMAFLDRLSDENGVIEKGEFVMARVNQDRANNLCIRKAQRRSLPRDHTKLKVKEYQGEMLLFGSTKLRDPSFFDGRQFFTEEDAGTVLCSNAHYYNYLMSNPTGGSEVTLKLLDVPIPLPNGNLCCWELHSIWIQ